MRVQISLQDNDFISFEYIPRSRIVGSYSSSIFNCLRNLHSVFHSSCTNLHSHQECTRVLFTPHPCQHLLTLVFWVIAILTGVKRYLIIFLTSISLVISDVDNFSCICWSFVQILWKTIYSGFCPFFFLIYLFIFGCAGSSFLREGPLQLRQVGATLHRGARASHHRGLPCCRAQAPDAQAQQLWLTGPAAPRHVGSSQTRAQTRVPRIGRQTPNHCATREAPLCPFFN